MDAVKSDTETVYKHAGDENHIVMNERVQALAGSIYEEFESMLSKYDQDVVKNLMPLIVNVLESLDLAYTENQELEVEVELLKEDNEQLVTQYEREKQLRKLSEQKNLEIEDLFEGERKELTVKLDSLSSIVKMFELKAKNSQDQIGRLEEKENEMKKEYSKLHERYTDLLKTHMDYMERSKMMLSQQGSESMIGSARNRIGGMPLHQLARSSGPVSYGYSELENNNEISMVSTAEAAVETPSVEYASANIRREMATQGTDNGKGQNIQHRAKMIDKGGWVEGGLSPEVDNDADIEVAEDISQDPSIGAGTPMSPSTPVTCTSHKKSEKRLGNNLYQELSFQDSDALGEVDEGADLTDSDNEDNKSYLSYDNGMGKEVENLIMENNELLATKNALNIVKDDLIAKVDELTGEHEILREEIRSLQEVRGKLQAKVQELEDEIKRVKEEADKVKDKEAADEEDVPMAQRKRFTRVEMARVLMERNQYKERFMELQEAVRWTEMIRASKTEPPIDKKNNKGIWKFFSNLFSGTERPSSDPISPYLNINYSQEDSAGALMAGLGSPAPGARAMDKKTTTPRGTDVFDGESMSSDKLTARRAKERKEQYKQVRAHVKKDDGRLQAYGWSLPARNTTSPSGSGQTDRPNKGDLAAGRGVPVPVPVYCRPLMEKEPGMKIWCAAGVNLTGGKTKDGGEIVGASVFYSSPPTTESKAGKSTGEDEISKLDAELKEGETLSQESARAERDLSSLVWICTSTHTTSKVTVIDANTPADVLESFHVCSSHLLCIASVPGAKEDDYIVDPALNSIIVEESNKEKEEAAVPDKSEEQPDADAKASEDGESPAQNPTTETPVKKGTISFVSCSSGDEPISHPLSDSPDNDNGAQDRKSAEDHGDAIHRRFQKEPSAKVKDGVTEVSRDNEIAYMEVEKMSSVLPTMWLGSQSGSVYVHSAVSQWKRCLHSIRLKDSVLSIVHVKGRVMAALANGTVAIFHRDAQGQWDLRNYYLLDLGKPHHSIRCMVQVHSKVWLGYRNKIHVVDPKMMCVEATFDAHPRRESQVRQMAWVGDGVWVSIRLDSTLRLYHAHTHQHLQDVDIEPYVSKMLGTGKLGFSFVRITALLVSCTRLWLGTGNGVIISVPLSSPESAGAAKPSSGNLIADVIEKSKASGAAVKVYSDNKERVIPGSFIPYCSMAQAQLSFHGHRDAVKFFVSVPGHGGLALVGNSGEQERMESMLVMSGGEGYIDFRLVEDGTEHDYDSHIMVWQLTEQSGNGGGALAPGPPPQPSSTPSIASSSSVMSLRSHASLELLGNGLQGGTTPGSGLALDYSENEEDGLAEFHQFGRLGMAGSVSGGGGGRRRAASSNLTSADDYEDNDDASSVCSSSRGTAGGRGSVISASVASHLNGAGGQIEIGTDPLSAMDSAEGGGGMIQWSREVESMLNNPPPDTFQSFVVAAEPSLSTWVIPELVQAANNNNSHHPHQTEELADKDDLGSSVIDKDQPASDRQEPADSASADDGTKRKSSSKSSSPATDGEPREDFTGHQAILQ